MGYDIRPIQELETYDYSLCSGLQNKNTVRISLDGNFFIVEGDTINVYTHQEILEIVDGVNWTNNEI